jgi:hypothetical protein
MLLFKRGQLFQNRVDGLNPGKGGIENYELSEVRETNAEIWIGGRAEPYNAASTTLGPDVQRRQEITGLEVCNSQRQKPGSSNYKGWLSTFDLHKL